MVEAIHDLAKAMENVFVTTCTELKLDKAANWLTKILGKWSR